MGWTIVLTPSGPELRPTGAGEPNPFADASIDWSSIPFAYQQNPALLQMLWEIYQQQQADAAGSGGAVDVGWADLVRDSALDIGKQAIGRFAGSLRNRGDRDAHIPAQKETGDAFGATVTAYNLGQISAAEAQAQIRQWNDAFQLLTRQIGSSRALTGGAYINDLAQEFLKQFGAWGTAVPPSGVTSPPAGSIQIAGTNISTSTLVALGALGVFLLMRRR